MPVCRQFGLPAYRQDLFRQTRPNGLRTGKIGIGEVTTALPADRPAAALHRDAVRTRPGDENARARIERQQGPTIGQKDQRFAHRLPRQGTMVGMSQLPWLNRQRAARRTATLEQAHAQLDAQDAPDRLVKAGHGDGAVGNLRQQCRMQRAPILRHHIDIEAGKQCLRAIAVGASRQLAMTVPVTHHQPVKRHFAAQQAGQKSLVPVHLDAIDA